MLGAREKIDTAFGQFTLIQLGKGVFSSTIMPRAYEAVPKDKAEKIVVFINNIIRNLSSARSLPPQFSCTQQQQLLTNRMY
jgi:hypothetical protein